MNKKLFLLWTIAAAFIMAPIWAMAASFTRVEIPSEKVYSPRGFDDNDDMQIIVTGFLPNLCYKNPHAAVNVIGKDVHVRVTAWKNNNPQDPCWRTQEFVPYLEIASVGMMNSGDYNIVVHQAGGTPLASEMHVAQAGTSAIDDYVYADVEYVETFKDSRKIVLHGFNPSDCYELDRIEFVSNGKDTYSVLPVMKQVREFCPFKMVQFAYETKVPEEIQARQILLHVRSLKGKSVNKIFFNVVKK